MSIVRIPRHRAGAGRRGEGTRAGRRLRHAGVAVLAVLLAAVGLLNAGPAFAANANSGEGTMSVSPASVVAGSTGNTLTFTFTAPANKFSSGSLVTLTVPGGWTAPSLTAGTPGYTTVTAAASCAAGAPSISGSGPWTITVAQTCDGGVQMVFAYGTGTNGTHVTAPSTPQTATFTAATRGGNSGNPVNLTAGSPQVTVTAGAASKLVFVQGPSNGFAGTALAPAVTVQLQDQNGNAVSASGVVVTLAPSAGVIDSGASATTNSSGRATFSGVVINTAALGLTLTASASGLTATAPSASFNVTVAVSSGAALTDTTSDGGGSGVKSVAYYYCAGYSGSCTSANWTLIGSSTTAGTYQVTWTSTPAAGAYRVVAVSTDNVTNASQPSASTPVTVS